MGDVATMATIADIEESIVSTGRRTRRPRWMRVLGVAGAVALVLSGGAVAFVAGLASRYENKVDREDILSDLPVPAAPTRWDSGPLNFLVLGSDSRGQDPLGSDDPEGARSDTIMVVHIRADHAGAFVFSIPRDSYVNVPPGGSWRGGKNKINSAFAFGGAKLAARTVFELTKIPLDGAMIVDFAGIHRMVGVVGTVGVCIPYLVSSIHTPRVWPPGCHEMGPEETEDFMRQRKSVPGGDFGRIHHQQLVIQALVEKIVDQGMLINPVKLDRLISTAAESVTVDNDTKLRDLVLALKDVAPANITFATTPYSGTANTSAGSSVLLDMTRARELFQAVIDDRTDDWLAANPQGPPSAS